MYGMISFKANGEQIDHAGQKPAFFGLTLNGVVINHYNSIEALQIDVAKLQAIEAASIETNVYEIAA